MLSSAARPQAGTWPVRDTDGFLTRETMISLAEYFGTKDHHPSHEMMEALTDLARTLEAMADEAAAPKFHLSSLDPGVGKTQTLVKFTDALLSHPDLTGLRGPFVCV